MRQYLITIYLAIFSQTMVLAQAAITGTISDQKGEPLIGANVYLKDTYDGATSDVDGRFSFDTYESGAQVLVISFVGFEPMELSLIVGQDNHFSVKLKEAFNTIDAVTISAGSFEASDKKKVVVLQSLDIATTAGATADITGALNTLPGTQTVGESGRLFVRGGTADETKIYVDGVEASNYYGASANNIPTRSRFSPFLFKGTFFSTGGYSAEYGQALSSALILNTLDVDPVSKVDISIMSLGLEAGVTKAWEEQSLYAKVGYINLNPYNHLIDQRVDWKQGVVDWNTNVAYKKNLRNGGKLKALAMGNASGMSLEQETILNPSGINAIGVDNKNGFISANLELPAGADDNVYIGVSSAWNEDHLHYNETEILRPTFNQHLKAKYVHEFAPQTILNTGLEFYYQHFKETITDSVAFGFNYNQTNTAAFAELDQYLTQNLVVRLGGRLFHLSRQEAFRFSPRISMAYKLDEHAQVSLASGLFYQAPGSEYLKITGDLDQQQAAHYILNYQRIKDNKVFRVETYLKDYDNLVRFSHPYDPDTFSSDGEGYAYGLDVFWRDRGGIENIDYWISYSWMKSERLYLDYPEKTEPGFTSAHNFSFVIKRFFPQLKSQMGATYSFTSGRPYENPNLDGFNESRTEGYHDLSFNIAYLPSPRVILYASATNLLGSDQIFGYNYANQPGQTGEYASEVIRLPARRFLFVGCFITIGAFNNQLENL